MRRISIRGRIGKEAVFGGEEEEEEEEEGVVRLINGGENEYQSVNIER